MDGRGVVPSEAKHQPVPSETHALRSTQAEISCPNCGFSVVGTFCADCGERQPSQRDVSVRGLVRDAFHEVTSIDGRLWKSLVALLTKPGLLTREWFEGRRSRYVKPFSLFVILNVAFFFIQPHTRLLSYKYQNYVYGHNAAARRHVVLIEKRRVTIGDTPAQFEVRFNAALQDQKKSLLVFCIPVLAIALSALYAGRRRFFAEHLVFSVHAYAFFLVFFAAMVPFVGGVLRALSAAGMPSDYLLWLNTDDGFGVMLSVVMGPYLFLALRRVYGDGRIAAVLRTAVLFYLIARLTDVYHDVLFYSTLYSL